MFTKIKNNIWLLLICLFIITISTVGIVIVSLQLMSQPSTISFVLGLSILLMTIFSSCYWNMIVIECAFKILKKQIKKK